MGAALRATSKIAFDKRTACPACGEASSRSVWSGRFSDRDVSGWLEQFHYDADLDAELGDQPFDLRRCSGCGQMYQKFVISDVSVPVVYGGWINDRQVALFEEEHTTKTDRFSTGVQLIKLVLRLRHLAVRLDHRSEPVRLLDFGCGSGEILRAASLLGMTAFGIDVSASRRAAAIRDGIALYPDLDRFDADVPDLVDIVVLNQVLEHVTAPLGLLQALRERLTKGGILFVAVPNCTGISRPGDFSAFHSVQPVEHVNAFTPESLRKLVRRAGFAPLKSPAAFVTTDPISAARTAASLLYHPVGTEQFFQRV